MYTTSIIRHGARPKAEGSRLSNRLHLQRMLEACFLQVLPLIALHEARPREESFHTCLCKGDTSVRKNTIYQGYQKLTRRFDMFF
jgi:hypothetical protein